MTIKQISVLLDNEPGSLSRVSDLLGKEGINIGAFSLTEATEHTIARMVTDNPKKTIRVLKNAKYQVWEKDVIAVVVPDHPGALNAVLKPLATAKINVNYLYPHLRKSEDNAVIIFRVGDNKKAYEVLKENWIQVIGEELYSL